jgi:hypothetical protein
VAYAIMAKGGLKYLLQSSINICYTSSSSVSLSYCGKLKVKLNPETPKPLPPYSSASAGKEQKLLFLTINSLAA